MNIKKRNIAVSQIVLVTFLVFFFNIHSKSQNVSPADDNERKVDYFERVYFSGKNKAGISALYLATIQELEGKSLSPAVEKQYNLLIALKDQVFDAKNACDALEIIAAAIYSIDAHTAMNQNIKEPTENVKTEILSNVSTALYNNVDSASKVKSYLSMYKNGSQVLKGLIPPKKDKPCKYVTAKGIQIGLHPIVVVTTESINAIENVNESKTPNTKITIKNIKYNQLSIIVSRIEKTVGIIDLNSDNYNNNIAILEIKHTLKTKDIVDKIITGNKEFKIVVESTSPDGIFLILK